MTNLIQGMMLNDKSDTENMLDDKSNTENMLNVNQIIVKFKDYPSVIKIRQMGTIEVISLSL